MSPRSPHSDSSTSERDETNEKERVHFDRAVVLCDHGRFVDARAEIMRHLAVYPEDAYGHVLLSQIHASLNDLAASEASAREAIRLEPDAPLTHGGLASALNRLRKHRGALAAAEEAIRLDPAYIAAGFERAMALLGLNRKRKAAQELERLLAIDPDDTDLWRARVLIARSRGKHKVEAESIRNLLRLDPNLASAHTQLGWMNLDKGKYDVALQAFREALSIDPDDGWAREGFTEALRSRILIYRPFAAYFRVLERIAMINPAIRIPLLILFLPALLPLIFLSILVGWVARTAMDVYLRFHPIGRYALTAEQIRATGPIAGLFVAGVMIAAVGYRGESDFLVLLGWTMLFVTILIKAVADSTNAHAQTNEVVHVGRSPAIRGLTPHRFPDGRTCTTLRHHRRWRPAPSIFLRACQSLAKNVLRSFSRYAPAAKSFRGVSERSPIRARALSSVFFPARDSVNSRRHFITLYQLQPQLF